MANMKLFERSLQRLAIRPASQCRYCRRSFAISSTYQQQQSATSFFTEMVENNSNKTPPTTRSPGRTTVQTSSRSSAFDAAASAVRQAARSPARREEQRQQQIQDLERAEQRRDLEGQLPRRWQVGDVYAPHDLSPIEAGKWKKQQRKPRPGSKGRDVIDMIGINPKDHYKNFSIMSEYMSEMGKIKHSNETGLRPVNQRRMAKAIRRAIGMGLMPSVHRHPELIRMEMERKSQRGAV